MARFGGCGCEGCLMPSRACVGAFSAPRAGHFATVEPFPWHPRVWHVFTRDLVTDLPRGALDDLIGAAGGRPNQRQPLRLERQDRGIDPWVDRIVTTGIHVGEGARHETQRQAARQKRGTNNETTHTCSPSLG